MSDATCAKCGGSIDPRGVNGENARTTYCEHICMWPVFDLRSSDPTKLPVRVEGCRAPIYFLVNQNETLQPFDRIPGGGPHHATCPAYKEWKTQMRATSGGPPEIACPRCGKLKARRGPCRACGWRPGQNPHPAVGLERFGLDGH